MTPRLIAFARPIGSGKTHAAKHLETKGFTRLSFADPLREMLLKLDPFVDEHFRVSDVVRFRGWDGLKEMRYGPEVRRLLQVLGTDIFRTEVSSDFWVACTSFRLRGHGWHENQTGRESIVIGDVRFKNEARQVKDFGGTVVFIDNPSVSAGAHASEQFDPAWADKIITNDGTAAFLEQVEGLFV